MKHTLVQLLATSLEVHMCDAHELWTLENLPEEIKNQEDGQADISSNEGIDVPWIRQKYLESVEEDDGGDEKDSKVAGVRLQGCLVR